MPFAPLVHHRVLLSFEQAAVPAHQPGQSLQTAAKLSLVFGSGKFDAPGIHGRIGVKAFNHC
jgi:hypothetical protein